MVIKKVLPEIDVKAISSVMSEIFKQYVICKCTVSNPDREQYQRDVESAVNLLADEEKDLITHKFMVSEYIKDYQVYNFMIDPPISKDTFMKIRASAFYKLAILFQERGILQL
ncbi:hypothetical protein C0Q44_15645 [Paenibacillus sp. PCH8]|uniref:hypothetical protein n=1 Tax=Paenibacillus sp. PCH8 TaxID=2066524 RepID=UPI000CF955B5|nr:hypothetical protein [Paenibacillus sp. PCH8]PQP82817.1 hypothetical protein C0Q44_15645 [Paenibacillus sp. PCH8]